MFHRHRISESLSVITRRGNSLANKLPPSRRLAGGDGGGGSGGNGNVMTYTTTRTAPPARSVTNPLVANG